MRDPLSILCVAETESVGIIGSSTATCVTIDGNQLLYATLGDSKFILIRDGSIVFESIGKNIRLIIIFIYFFLYYFTNNAIEQQHEFNTPYQIGALGDGLDQTDIGSLIIKNGDIILMGTDGLFDNLYI